MSGATNGQQSRLGFPQAPSTASYQPVAQFNQFATSSPQNSAIPSTANGAIPKPVLGQTPNGVPFPMQQISASSAFKPYGGDMKPSPSQASPGPSSFGAPPFPALVSTVNTINTSMNNMNISAPAPYAFPAPTGPLSSSSSPFQSTTQQQSSTQRPSPFPTSSSLPAQRSSTDSSIDGTPQTVPLGGPNSIAAPSMLPPAYPPASYAPQTQSFPRQPAGYAAPLYQNQPVTNAGGGYGAASTGYPGGPNSSFPPQPSPFPQQLPTFPPQLSTFPSQQPSFPPQPSSYSSGPSSFPSAFPTAPNVPSTQPYAPSHLEQNPSGGYSTPAYRNDPASAANYGQGYATTPGYPGQPPIHGLAQPRALSDFLDLSAERNPIGNGGLEESSYSLPSNINGHEFRCDPSVFRSTLNSIPQTEELLSKSRLPLGLTLHPFRDIKQLNVVKASTIVRCRYCRTYINPYVYLPDARRWRCNLCFKNNDLPEDFCYDAKQKVFTDATKRPEMQFSTVEFIAPSEYMLRPPQPAVYVFIFDVSTPAIQCGYLETFSEQFLISLDQLPGDERTLMAFMAVDSSLHFFQFHTTGKLPKELVVDEIDDAFLPTNMGLLVSLHKNREAIRQFVQRLPSVYSTPSSYSSQNCLGAALVIAKEMIGELGGRVSVFQCAMPSIGPGALNTKEDPNQRSGPDADVKPSTDFYKRLALECTAVQMGIDIFCLASQHVDLASISESAKFSSGSLFHFPAFHSVDNAIERRRFEKVLTRYLTRKIGFEAVLRIRCSRGLGISSFYGNCFVRSTDLLSLANVSPDCAVGVQLNIEEKLTSPTACFQAALLYTSSKGERRIRVHTLCLPTTSELTTLFANVDVRATVSLIAKMGVDRACQGSPLADCREAVVNASVDGLGAFSKTAGRTGLLTPRGGQLKYLPLFSLALLKHTAFSAGRSVKRDARVAAMCALRSGPIEEIVSDVYPLLFRLNDIMQLEEGQEPTPLPLSFEYVTRDGVFLMIAGHTVMVYVAASSDPSFVKELFGTNYHQLDTQSLREHSSPVSQRVHAFLHTIMHRMQIFNFPIVVREDSQLRDMFVSRFVDDRSECSHSYVEFINHIKKEIGH